MYDPRREDYPTNVDGNSEFASVVMTIDEVVTSPRFGSDVLTKLALSTQTAAFAIQSLFDYEGEYTIMHRPSTIDLFMQAGRVDEPVFVYTTQRRTHVVLSTPAWNTFINHPDFGQGSVLLASVKLQDLVASTQETVIRERGGVAPLLVFGLSLEERPAEQPPLTPETHEADAGENPDISRPAA